MSLLVVSAAGTAPVAATDDFGGDWVKELGWAVTFPVFGDLLGYNQQSEEMASLTDNATHVDLYEAMVSQEIQTENTVKTIDSYTQDSRTFAFIKAENATIQGLRAGETEGQLNTSARSSVTDYYTVAQQEKLLNAWEIQTSEYDYVQQRVSNTSGLTAADVSTIKGGLDSYSESTDWTFVSFEYFTYDYVGTQMQTVTYANGTARDVPVPVFDVYVTANWDNAGTPITSTTTDPIRLTLDPTSSSWTASGSGLNQTNSTSTVSYTINVDNVTSDPPDGSTLTVENYYTSTQVPTEWVDSKNVATQVADNADVYASALYSANQNGTLDLANYSSPYMMAQEYASDYNSTGYWSYAIAMLSSTGTATPDLNNTAQMWVEYNGITHEGLVMASQFPNGTLEVNTTYDGTNTSAFGSRAWLVTTNGDRLLLDGQFTVEKMTDKDGSTKNSTTAVTYAYEGVNMDDYRDLQNQTKALMEEIQKLKAGSGSDSGSDGLSQGQLIVGVIALLAIAMATKDR